MFNFGYQTPNFEDDYITTLTEFEQCELNPCIGICMGCSSCIKHLARFNAMVHASLADFIASHKHMVIPLVARLKVKYPDIYHKLPPNAELLPLVSHTWVDLLAPIGFRTEVDFPCFVWSGSSSVRYFPGKTTMEIYQDNRADLGDKVGRLWCQMDSCCQESKCENHKTVKSLRYKESCRMVQIYESPSFLLPIRIASVFD